MVQRTDAIKAVGSGLKQKKGGLWVPTGEVGIPGVPTPTFRLKGSDLALADGAAVTAWGPLGVVTGSPVFVANGIGGKPSVQFTGDDALKGLAAVPAHVDGAKSFSIFAVAKAAALGARMGLAITGTGVYGAWLTVESTAKIGDRSGGVALAASSTGVVTINDPFVGGVVHDVPGNQSRMYRDGADGVFTNTVGHWYGGGTGFEIGGRAGGDFFNGLISEVLYWANPLTVEEASALVAFLITEYQL